MLTLDHVIFGYDDMDILKNVTTTIPHGTLTCIVGPNGAGKSTLLRVMAGSVRPRHGTVTYQGKNLSSLSLSQIVDLGIHLVEQNSLFPDMTVEENIRLGGMRLHNQHLADNRFDLVATHFPFVKQRAREKAGTLSGGQQRIIEIVRALMLDPSLLLLDEPTVGLDPHALARVLDTVQRLHQQGKTIVLTEQNVRAGLSIATTAIVLENEHIRSVGSPAHLHAEDVALGDLLIGSPHGLAQKRPFQAQKTGKLGEERALCPIVLLLTMGRITQGDTYMLELLASLPYPAILVPTYPPEHQSPLDLLLDDHRARAFFEDVLWPLFRWISTVGGGACFTGNQQLLQTALIPGRMQADQQPVWKAIVERYVALLFEHYNHPYIVLHPGEEEQSTATGQQPAASGIQGRLQAFLAHGALCHVLALPETLQDKTFDWVRRHDQNLLLALGVRQQGHYHTQKKVHSSTPLRYSKKHMLERKRMKLRK